MLQDGSSWRQPMRQKRCEHRKNVVNTVDVFLVCKLAVELLQKQSEDGSKACRVWNTHTNQSGFPSKMRGGGGPSATPAERVSRTRRSTRPGVATRPPAHGVCSSRGGGDVSDNRSLPEDLGRNTRRNKTSRPSRQSAICGRQTPESVLRACNVH